MSTAAEPTKTEEMSSIQIIGGLARHYLGGRRGLMLFGATAVVAGVVLNWSWFVAAGLAPILLALAPCAAMCALGLCMNKVTGNKSCSTKSSAAAPEVKTNASSTGVSVKTPAESGNKLSPGADERS